MQRLQFSRGLAFFCQIGVSEQSPDVMCNDAKQIAIIRSIGLAMKLLAQRHEGRELPPGHGSGNRALLPEAAKGSPAEVAPSLLLARPSSINTGSSFSKSCTMTGWESSIGTGSFSAVIERIRQNCRSASRNDQIEMVVVAKVLIRRSSRRSMIASLLAAC